MKILLIGANGKLGTALQAVLRPVGQISAYSRTELDITDQGAVSKIIEQDSPDIVLNASAYTNVRGAETDRGTAEAVNATAVGELGSRAARQGAIVIHISTDFVFDGTAHSPYREDDATGPLNVYGSSKLIGERALIESGAACAILRTAWLYDSGPNNFVGVMIARTKAGDPLRVVDDQIGSPTSVPVLAQAIRAMLTRSPDALRRLLTVGPVFHTVCRGRASWFDLALAAIEDAGLSTDGLSPISTDQSGETLKRPANSVLDCSRFEQTFSVRLPHWRAAARSVVASRPQD
ncbi:MAG: dTDP-4-dehydrorhamnose reductase [Pseudomonadota bacterium]